MRYLFQTHKHAIDNHVDEEPAHAVQLEVTVREEVMEIAVEDELVDAGAVAVQEEVAVEVAVSFDTAIKMLRKRSRGQ